MIPRVFVSSTYYDLKHVRERVEKFFYNYGFEPILFESDRVTYQHNKELDQSAYFEVTLCHMMVLIVGGRYGSLASQNNIIEERKKYDETYISITRKEFETAIQKNIPILIFLDKNVHAEYKTYIENKDFFDNNLSTSGNTKSPEKFKFAHVDDVNIFKFIDLLQTKPIKTFEKIEEIEVYMKLQLSGMFYLYLESLKKKSEENKILDTISELNNIALRMNEMLTSVGKQVLSKDNEEYEKVIDSQFRMMVDFFTDQVYSNISFENFVGDDDLKNNDITKITNIVYEKALVRNISDPASYKKLIEQNKSIIDELQTYISKINPKIVIRSFNFRNLNKDLKRKVLPFVKNDSDEEYLIQQLATQIYNKVTDLPF